MLKIYTYNAGKGDCIRISFGSTHNIIVDTGVMRFGRKFQEICDEIESNGEVIDAMVITHMDNDHLGGALYVAKHGKMPNIQQIWMNCLDVRDTVCTPLSAKQNNELYAHMISKGIQVCSILRGNSVRIDDAEISFLWPTKEIVEAVYCEPSKTPLSNCSDYGRKLSVLANEKITVSDASGSNRASIVFSFRYEGKLLLFTGDAWGNDIVNSISDDYFDLIKLPHHGSARNITEEWKNIKCSQYLICTDGHSHPDKQTIAKLHKWNGEITIYSPSEWWENNFYLDDDNRENIHCILTNGEPIIL